MVASSSLPAQAGRAPRHPGEIETTESDYRDGDLASDTMAASPVPVSATSKLVLFGSSLISVSLD